MGNGNTQSMCLCPASTGPACLYIPLALVGGALVSLSPLTTYMCHLWVCGWKVNTSKNSLSSAPNPLPYPSSLSSAPYKAPNPDSSQLRHSKQLILNRPSLRNHCLLLAHLKKKKVPGRVERPAKESQVREPVREHAHKAPLLGV